MINMDGIDKIGDSASGSPGGVVDFGEAREGMIKKPFLFNDIFLVTDVAPWAASAVQSGTFAQRAGEPNHPGVGRISCSATQYSGVNLRFGLTQILLGGGERSDVIVSFAEINNIDSIIGFSSTPSGLGAIAGIVDAACIRVPSGGVAVGINGSNSTATVSAAGFQIVINTWYRFVTEINADATSVFHSIYSDSGELLWSDTLTTNIPKTDRTLGHHVTCYTSIGSAARVLMDVDAIMLTNNRELLR